MARRRLPDHLVRRFGWADRRAIDSLTYPVPLVVNL